MHVQDNYVMDSKGIQEKVFILKRIIARLDDKLFAHLEAMEVEFLQVMVMLAAAIPLLYTVPSVLRKNELTFRVF